MKIIKQAKKILSAFLKIGYRILTEIIPVNRKMILFISFHGKGYSDSPKAIYEEMLNDERFKEWEFVWVIRDNSKKNISIPGAKIVDYLSLEYFIYLSKAKYWVFNCKMPEYVYKKKDQVYLQTWHGTPLKRLGFDIIVPEGTSFYRSGMSFEKMTKGYAIDSAKYDYMISPNRFSTEVFQTAFRVKKSKLVETGYPRNDFIVNASQDDCRKIKNKYGIPEGKKVVLYAPTWRDNSFDMKGYTFELKADFYKWKDILGEEYVLIFKPHYLIVNKYKDKKGLEDFMYNIPAEADINELYVISDVLITDYSSVFFDYSVLNRPVYFYMYDLEEYREELRGFYLDIYTELPGDIYENEDELLENVKDENYNYERMNKFNERFNEFHNGDSARKVVNILLEGK